MPLVYGEIKKDAIIFIGMNPSFNVKAIKKLAENCKEEAVIKDPKKYFSFNNKNDFEESVTINLDREARKSYPYFNKFKELAEYVGMKDKWDHIDLFFARETSQKNFLKNIMCKEVINDFGKKQLELSSALLVNSKPKLIIVANAKASEIFKNEYKPLFSDVLGCYLTDIKLKKIPTIFTSMLTGQRALDTHSFESLKWNSKRIMISPYQKVEA